MVALRCITLITALVSAVVLATFGLLRRHRCSNRHRNLRNNEVPARARDIGIAPGILTPGPLNAITDVAGVLVGHVTLTDGQAINTGATAILPHGGNLYRDRVPAGFHQGNGYGKFAGSTQVIELGELETPIILTNTLSVPQGMEAAISWTLKQSGNEAVRSVNAVVGENNDGYLNDIEVGTCGLRP